MTPQWEQERTALRAALIEAAAMLGHLTESGGVNDADREDAEAIIARAAQALYGAHVPWPEASTPTPKDKT